jgi:hypothetical protein
MKRLECAAQKACDNSELAHQVDPFADITMKSSLKRSLG